MNDQTIEAMMSSESPDWNTPHNVLEVIREFSPIGLDPCSNDNSIVNAKYTYSLTNGTDGLVMDWVLGAKNGIVYVNPPYGKPIKMWLSRCGNQHLTHNLEIVALVPARTDTKWWHASAPHCDAICFWKGRLKFLGGKSCAPFPSALLYWGNNVFKFADVLQNHGQIVLPS